MNRKSTDAELPPQAAPATEPTVAPTNELTVEDIARQAGWRAPEEMQNPPKNPKTAAEWLLARGSVAEDLKHKLDQQSAKLEEATDSMVQARRHFDRLEASRTARVKADYENRRKEAIEQSDYEAVQAIERERDQQLPPDYQTQEPAPALTNWQKNNSWYGQDAQLTEMADLIADGLAARQVPLEEGLRTISARMAPYLEGRTQEPSAENEEPPRAAFEQEATGDRSRFRGQPPAVEVARAPAQSSARFSAQDLTAQERRYGEALVKSGAMDSLDEYAAQLAELEGLNNE